VNNKVIAFIGAGSMARSLVGGLVADGYDPKEIWVSNPSLEKLLLLQQQFGVNITQDNEKAMHLADIVVLAVKPHSMKEVIQDLKTKLIAKQCLIISVAAGITETTLQRWLGSPCPIVRCMPNTPVLVGSGATGLFANHSVTQEQKNAAESIMRAVGVIAWLEKEELIDIVTALSGCGPAYYFLIMESFETAAEQMGLPKAIAHLFTLQTALGAAQMAMKVDVSCQELRRNVASPGGVTEQAIKVLEEGGIRALLQDAMNRAREKAIAIESESGSVD
jgi:pyrroline-5-carboxylate reductase